MKQIKCKDCHYGDINFWGYIECSKFNQKLDGNTTSETADRERTACTLNLNNDCVEYKKRGFIEKHFPRLYVKRMMKNLSYT